MFHAERWALAFLAVSGKDADEAYLCLKAIAAPVKKVHGVFFGHGSSVKLEKVLRESIAASSLLPTPHSPLPIKHAIRFICLLVEKNCFKYIDLLLQRIEQKLDEQKGTLALSLEAAAPVDSGFEKELAQMIKTETGAADVKMKTCVRPELLGGYLLRTEGFYIDASLKGQLEKMKMELNEVI